MNQGDKPLENFTGNTRVQGMIYGPATYFSFPIIRYNWHCPGIEEESPAGVLILCCIVFMVIKVFGGSNIVNVAWALCTVEIFLNSYRKKQVKNPSSRV